MDKSLINLEAVLSVALQTATYTLTEKTLVFNIEKQLKEYIDGIQVDDPVIKITTKAYQKMMGLVDAIDKEIAWHGVVEVKDRTYTIKDILVYPQVVTGTTVDSNDEAYAKWFADLPDEMFYNIRMQGHSHVNMGVSPSGVDEKYYKELLKHVEDFYIVIIANKRREFMIRFYDIANNLIYTTNEFSNRSATDWAQAQITKFVESKSYNYGHPSAFWGGYNTQIPKKEEKKEEKQQPTYEDIDNMSDEEYVKFMRTGGYSDYEFE